LVNFDTKEEGLKTVVKDYQEMALRFVWAKGKDVTSRDAWKEINKILLRDQSIDRLSISRASIINFLNDAVEEGYLSYSETTGKGGHRGLYSAGIGEEGFKRQVVNRIVSKLLETWPEITGEEIKKLAKGDQRQPPIS
jgi:hypothetical protein